jgi:hypothetical protein
MTTEIAVANKWGIAIAADSAVTVEQLHKGELKEKVYNSANKLFTLSKWHPVGAMIYNTMTLGGTPWETLIKSIRRDLGRREFDRIGDYADFFVGQINSSPIMFPEDSASGIIEYNVYRLLRDLCVAKDNAQDFSERLEKRIASLENLESIPGFDATFEKKIIQTYSAEIKSATDLALKPAHARGIKRKIDRLVQLSFVKKERLSGWSGIVLAGFGKLDVFPALIEFYSDIVVCGRARLWQVRDMRIGRDKRSFVVPFADTEIIKTITEGINPRFQQKFIHEAVQMISSLPDEVLAQVSELDDAQKEAYANAASATLVTALRTFLRAMTKYRQDEYVAPIEQTLQVLPVSELATVAETFLNASQIHKRVTPEMETVGGPVDVAVISKGDGFVWIKRKHYFNRDLNPAFIDKYLDN